MSIPRGYVIHTSVLLAEISARRPPSTFFSMSTLGKGEATYIFLRLAYTGSHLQVPSMLPRLVSYVQACCEAVNILETFVGVS